MGNETSLNLSPVPHIVNPRTRGGVSSTDSSPKSPSPSFRSDDRARRPLFQNELMLRGPPHCRTPPVNRQLNNGVNKNVGQNQGLLHQQVYQGPLQTVGGRHCCLLETRQPAGVVKNIALTERFNCNASTASGNEKRGDNTELLGGEQATTDRLKPQPPGSAPHRTMGELSAEFAGQGSDIINTGRGTVSTVAIHGVALSCSDLITHSSCPSPLSYSDDIMNSHGNETYQSFTDSFRTGAFSDSQTRECCSVIQSGFSTRTGKSFDTENFSVNSEMFSSRSQSWDSKSLVACNANSGTLFDENSNTFSSLKDHNIDMTCLGLIAKSTEVFINGPQSDNFDYRSAVDHPSQSGGFMSRLKSDVMTLCEMPSFGPTSRMCPETPSFGPTSRMCPSDCVTMNSQYGAETQSFQAATNSIGLVSQDDILMDDKRDGDQTVDAVDGVDDLDGPHSISGYFSNSSGPSSVTSLSEITDTKKRMVFAGQIPNPHFPHMFDSQGFYFNTANFNTAAVAQVDQHTGCFYPLNPVHLDEVTRSLMFEHTVNTSEPPLEALPELFDNYNFMDARDMSGSSGFISPVTDPSSPDLCPQVNLTPAKSVRFMNLDQDSNKENSSPSKPGDRRTIQKGILLRPNQNIQPSLSSEEFSSSGEHCAASKKRLCPIRNGGQGGSGRLCLADDQGEELSSEEDDRHELVDVVELPRTQGQQGIKDEIKSPVQQLQIQFTEPKKEPRIYYDEPANDILSIFDDPFGRKRYYAAYLCCAAQDLEQFGKSFHAMVEAWGFRIFLAPRDLVLSGPNFENMSRALEERCNGKIIVILSNNYASSGECQFLTAFARVLDPDAKRRNIIPVQIDKNLNEFPNVLKGLCIIRYNHDYKCGWLKGRLVDAIAA